MFDTNKNYWLYIAPHVYCCLHDARALLYNTIDGGFMEAGSKEIIALLQLLHEKKNIGAVYFEGQKLAGKPYQSFLTEFCEKNMGGLVDVEQVKDKPIQLMPILNLQRDVEKLQKDRERFIGENVLHYLMELNVYVNAACDLQCTLCATYFRQSLCCTSAGNGQQHLSKHTLQNILAQIQYAPVGKLNILGGNILKYAYYKDLEALLQLFKEHTHLWVHYVNVVTAPALLSGFKYDIPVTFPVDEKQWAACLHRLKDEAVCYHFFITGEEDYHRTGQLLDACPVPNYTLHPVYTGNNLPFFEAQVYLTKDDIFSRPLSFREIFAHQKLNTNFFGLLTVMNDGKVYANINAPALGAIETDTLLELVNKEMNDNTAWRRIRNEAPCAACQYQFLCPSPANYERVIGQPNLCCI
jgi:pseudo-rSAM protein